VVTGGSRGIGLAIATALAQAGASVAICSRNQAHVDDAVRQLTDTAPSKVVGKAADVANSSEVAALFEFVDRELAGVDVLVNNAGIGVFAKTADLTDDQWQRTIDTNLSGAFFCSRQALARFKTAGAGYIINIGSLAGKNAFSGGAAYNASKFGLRGFSEAMMLDHRYENVRVTHIMPGSVSTKFSPDSGSTDWKIAPEDIADIVLMLLRMPERSLVSQVEVRPSKPQK